MVKGTGDVCDVGLAQEQKKGLDQASDCSHGPTVGGGEGRHRKMGAEQLVGAVYQVQLQIGLAVGDYTWVGDTHSLVFSWKREFEERPIANT